MSSDAITASLDSGHKWKLRILALAAAVLFAFGIYFVQRLPAAETLASPDDELVAKPAETIALYNLRAAPVMQYDGAVDAGLRISATTGRLTATTRRNLSALNLVVPNVKGAPIQWQAKPPAGGRISVRVGNERQAPDAGMMLQAAGSGQVVQLRIRAVQTVLTAQIEIVTQGASEASAPEFKFGDASFSSPELGFSPLQIELPPGESMILTFDNQDAYTNSTIRFGELFDESGSATALGIGRAEVGRLTGSDAMPQLDSVIRGVCAARARKLLYTHLYPRADECGPAAQQKDDKLFATELKMEPQRARLELDGSGFVIEDGRARPATLWSAFMGNPLIAALFGALIYAFARPVWRLWTGREM